MQTPKFLSAGSLYGHLVSSPQFKCPRRPFMFPQKYHVSVSNMLSKSLKYKTNSNINFRGLGWVRAPTKFWVKGFILRHKYHAPNFYQKIPSMLQLYKNAKTNNNITGYHVVSRPVISVFSDVQRVYRCPKGQEVYLPHHSKFLS